MATDPPQGEVRTVELTAEPISAQAFAPYGTLIEAIADGQLFGPSEAQLALTAGTPRLYIMELPRRALQVRLLTRHRAVTQCLASAGGKEWFIVVAPPDGLNDPSAEPNIGMVRGFRIPGDVAVKMHRGTWHAGPYFVGETARFLNLELADTNQVDHQSTMLGSRFGFEYDIRV
jgi:ureidoglycolate lyase